MLLALLNPAPPGVACDNPARHPELAEISRLLEGLAAEPPAPVQLLFKVVGEPRVGSPVQVTLSFWPKEPYEEGWFRVLAGPGISVLGEAASIEIPFKGSHTLEALPTEKGHRYLKVETVARVGAEERRNTAILSVPVEVDRPESRRPPPPTALGFSGSRLRAMLREPASLVP
jgi:hypothetical protein